MLLSTRWGQRGPGFSNRCTNPIQWRRACFETSALFSVCPCVWLSDGIPGRGPPGRSAGKTAAPFGRLWLDSHPPRYVAFDQSSHLDSRLAFRSLRRGAPILPTVASISCAVGRRPRGQHRHGQPRTPPTNRINMARMLQLTGN
jgi:hypothetical protein